MCAVAILSRSAVSEMVECVPFLCLHSTNVTHQLVS